MIRSTSSGVRAVGLSTVWFLSSARSISAEPIEIRPSGCRSLAFHYLTKLSLYLETIDLDLAKYFTYYG